MNLANWGLLVSLVFAVKMEKPESRKCDKCRYSSGFESCVYANLFSPITRRLTEGRCGNNTTKPARLLAAPCSRQNGKIFLLTKCLKMSSERTNSIKSDRYNVYRCGTFSKANPCSLLYYRILLNVDQYLQFCMAMNTVLKMVLGFKIFKYH